MKKRLTLEEHRQLGAQLRWLAENLLTAAVKVANARGVSATTRRRAKRALDLINEVRSELEEVLYRDFPHLEREEMLDYYYGHHRNPPVLKRR